MDLSLEEANAKAKLLKSQGDKEFIVGSVSEAYNLYKKSYEYTILYYSTMHNRNSGIYRRLALALYTIDDDPKNYTFYNLLEAKRYTSLYIKIRRLENKALKNDDILYFILGMYNLKREKFEKAIRCSFFNNFHNRNSLFQHLQEHIRKSYKS